MKLKSIAAGAALFVAAVAAQAGTASVALNQTAPGFWSAGYDSDFLVGPLLGGAIGVAGTDTWTFNDFAGMAVGQYEVELDFHELLNGATAGVKDPIKVTSAFLNALPISYQTKRTFTIDGTTTSPFTLTVNGMTNFAGAGYHGTITVTAVPEPETYAMLLAGLGLMGGIARRRNNKAA